MRHALLSVLLSTLSAQAIACTSYGPTVQNFLDELADVGRFNGKETTTTIRGGTRTVRNVLDRAYKFRKTGNNYLVERLRCGTGAPGTPSGQCEQGTEETWRFNPMNHCLSVGLTTMTITRATDNELRFQNTRGGVTTRTILTLPARGQMNMEKSATSRGGSETLRFIGR